uniref:Cytochrome P450 n=1 Tax=Glossina brevipalpis TaxID=37001 RepID=A0A1A9X1I7_9MUSC
MFNKIYGPMWCSWLGPYPFVVISDPVIVQEVLLSPNCINKCVIYDGLDYTVGTTLFNLKEPKWSVHRKIFNPAFNHKILMSFIPLFNEEVHHLMLTVDKYVGNGPADLMRTMQTYTLYVATRTTMRSMLMNRDQFERTLVQSYQCCFKLVDEQLLSADNDERSPDSKYFIDIAIENFKSDRFTRANVEHECGAIVFGAFETTANTIVYTLMLLAMFPNYQEKVYEELISIFPETGNFNVTYNNTQNLIYMDMVLNETMRVLAPVPLIARETTNNLKLSNGVTLPSGVQIAIDIFHMHRRKDIWGPEADSFNPDNFLSANIHSKHSYAFIPFTKGLRYCIGMKYALLSIKITLAKLLRNYKFATDFKFEKLEFIEDITLKLREVPLLAIERRN